MTHQQSQHTQENQQNYQNRRHDAGITDVLGSMMGLAAASTRFTWRQMQNAAGIMTGSKDAWNDMRDSMNEMCDAMSHKSNGHSESHPRMHPSEPQSAEEAFTGRKL